MVGRLRQGGCGQGHHHRLQGQYLQADQGHHPCRAGEDSVLLPWNLTFNRPAKPYTGSDLKSDTANVTISESCTLSDATIDGDLYLTEGLASDAVQLNDVYVKGTIIVAGGTVTMTNTMSDHIVVSSPMGRLLQVTAAGARSFSEHGGPQHSGALREKADHPRL